MTSGGGERKGACELVKSGAFDLNLSYDVPTQAADMAAMIKWLISSGAKAGSIKGSAYTTLISITKANAASDTACWNCSATSRNRRSHFAQLVNGRALRTAVHVEVRARRTQDIQVPFSPGSPMQDMLLRLRYRYWPDHLLGEILSKRWTETAIPVIVLLIVGNALSRSIDGFLDYGSLRRHRAPGSRNRFYCARDGSGRHRRRD